MTKNNIIRTSHQLNHFRGNYTKLELDFIYSFISEIREEDKDFKKYSLSLSELQRKLNKPFKTRDIEPIFDTLMSKKFKVNNNKKLAIYNFFITMEFDKEKRLLSVKFSPDLKPHLLKLDQYARGNLKYILEFKSMYSKRLYMLIAQWKKRGTFKYKVEEIREVLAVPEVYDYGNFKRRVLKTAEKELFEKSNIYFEYEEIKIGKKVESILFIIKNKAIIDDYLINITKFIDYMRDNHVNDDILFATDKNNGVEIIISISKKGMLYDKYQNIEIDKIRAKEIWNTLFSYAKKKELKCLKKEKIEKEIQQ
ncbi:MAG: replication initiation protein [Sulfurospirillum sp.]|nr:replication initiation protein [Sulfurospirillum sp.]